MIGGDGFFQILGQLQGAAALRVSATSEKEAISSRPQFHGRAAKGAKLLDLDVGNGHRRARRRQKSRQLLLQLIGKGFGVAAFRVSAASEERTSGAAADDHRRLAFIT